MLGYNAFPPNRVHSLKIAYLDAQNMIITIIFPAPGDNMDAGTDMRK